MHIQAQDKWLQLSENVTTQNESIHCNYENE